MTRSPPFLVSSSPGPDPYRSNDNVYEELGPGRDSDGESEVPMHSDDDFAEDELSLPGERSFNKSVVSEAPSTLPAVSTIYHERAATTNAGNSASGAVERNSVMSSSSSTNQDNSTATAASSSSSHNNNGAAAAAASAAGSSSGGAAALLNGMLRHTTGRSKFQNGARAKVQQNKNTHSTDDFNTSSSTADTVDIAPIQQLYDNRSNLMSLGYQQQTAPSSNAYHHSLHHLHHNNNARSTAPQFYNTLENEVERRNRINAQLSHAAPVSTIFRERIHYPGSGRYPQPYYASNSSNGLLASSMRARTNPRDRRQRINAPTESMEAAYAYAEPMYHHNYHYDSCNMSQAAANQRLMGEQQRLAYPAYIMPDYASSNALYRGQPHSGSSAASSSSYAHPLHLYGRGGDSSFGSDSGYSHHTPASSIGRHDYDVALPINSTSCSNNIPKSSTTSKLQAALNFGWNRRKSTPSTPTSLNVMPNSNSSSNSNSNNSEANSPNNNSSNNSSTLTSSLENSCSNPNNNLMPTTAAPTAGSQA